METSGGMLSRVGEKVLGWVALAIIALLAIAIYRMPGETKVAIWESIWRTGVWVVIVAALPWGSRLIIGRIVEIGSNWAGFGLIAGLIALDIVAAVVLMTGWPSGGWTWAASLGALALAGTYNYLVTEYLAEMAG